MYMYEGLCQCTYMRVYVWKVLVQERKCLDLAIGLGFLTTEGKTKTEC